jgi:tape measure domain-containing protein
MADVKINLKVVGDAALRSIRNLENATEKTQRSVNSLNNAASSTANIFKGVFAANIATTFVNNFASAVGNLVSTGASAAQNLETLSTQFEVLTGSAGEANAIVQDLTDFAARTPFRFEGIASAAQRLLSFGFSSDEVKDRLQDLGDVAAASGADIGELSLIFGQVRAAGQLTGERLLQLQERAIPIGPALAKSLGVAESSVRDLVRRGEVDFATFEEAFRSLNETGEFAFEGLEKRSQTLEGRLSTLSEDVELLGASVFQAFVPALKAGAAVASEFLGSLRESGALDGFLKTLQSGIPLAVQTTASALTILVEVFQGTRIIINTIRAGFNAFAQTLVDGTISILEATIAAKEFLGLDTSGLNQTVGNLKILSETFEEVGTESLQANEDIRQSREELVALIEGTSDTLVGKIDAEKQAAIERGNATVEANKKIIESETQKKDLLTLFAEEAKIAAEEGRAEELAVREAQASEDFQFLVKNLGEEEAARVAAQAKRLENEGKTNEALKVLTQSRIKAEQEATKKQKEEDDKRVSDRKSTLSTIATLQGSSNKTLVALGKAAALASIAIDGPAAVTKALNAAPPPFNFALAATVAAAVAAQAAKVAGVGFQDGGIVGGNSFSGDQVPIRVNSGEMVLNRQQQTQLFDLANGGAKGPSQVIQSNVTVELDGEVVGRTVSRQVADGLELGELI